MWLKKKTQEKSYLEHARWWMNHARMMGFGVWSNKKSVLDTLALKTLRSSQKRAKAKQDIYIWDPIKVRSFWKKTLQIPSFALVRLRWSPAQCHQRTAQAHKLRWSPAHATGARPATILWESCAGEATLVTSAQPKRTTCAGHQRKTQAHDQRQFSGRVTLVRLRW